MLSILDNFKKKKTHNEIIDEIHESFFTEVDRLLVLAKVSRSTETQHEDLIKKRDRLVKLGFTQSIEVIEADLELKRINDIVEENKNNSKLVEAINYFSMKYPNYKFITVESVEKICKKYGLIYSTINRFKGIVPEENLSKIEEFKIEDVDKEFLRTFSFGLTRKSVEKVPYEEFYKNTNTVEQENNFAIFRGRYDYKYSTSPLNIAATPSEFNTDGMEISGMTLKIVENDPIVLQPIHYDGGFYFLVVTAWGKEASDDLVVNERNN